jgi:hypothetical protein
MWLRLGHPENFFAWGLKIYEDTTAAVGLDTSVGRLCGLHAIGDCGESAAR